MDIVVQRVQTSWTKKSRGGAEAALRNAASTAFALPPGLSSALHEVTMRESDAFQPRMQVRELTGAGIGFREVDGLLRVAPPEIPSGVPRRDRRPPAVRLAPGQWLQWQINHRFGGGWSGTWTYRLETFNVAYGPVPPDVFLGTASHRVDERGFLR